MQDFLPFACRKEIEASPIGADVLSRWGGTCGLEQYAASLENWFHKSNETA
jgi:hypothetical protein